MTDRKPDIPDINKIKCEDCRYSVDNVNENRDRLIDEAKDLMRERDEAIEYGDTEHEFAESLVKDLHEARNVARDYRDLYAAEIDESIAAFPLPWEEDHDADRDGQ